MAQSHVTKYVIYIIVAILVGAGILFYSQYSQQKAGTQVQQPVSKSPNLIVSSQSLVGNEIVIDSLYLDKPGYVVVHKETEGKPGAVIGHSDLISGEKTNLKVTVDASQSGTKVFAMLHYDDDNDGVYGFPDEDKPVLLEGSVLVKPISITQQPPQQPQQSTQTITGTVAAAKQFTIEADDNKFNPSTITVSKGDKVNITFKFLDSNIYFGGLDVKSPKWTTVEYKKGSATSLKSVEFTADSTFTFSSYWPASGVWKADGQVVVA